ncbi:hypothetical protein AB4Y63_01125 [Leifsonia sp. YAF41]|uniref:hypothetical protein n=1 Tax=Leifsonia sp. YAF41 TaxID=3233086 RepID=UPI003F95A5E4
MTEPESHAAPGDVFAFPLERIARFGACQVVAIDENRGLATVAVLAWTGTAAPEIAEVEGVPRMVRDFMFWRPEEILKNVPLAVPAAYRRIGTLPVTGETVSRSSASWDFARQVERQHRWDSIPSDTRSAFKAVVDSEETAITPGLTYSREPYAARLGAALSFSDDAGYQIGTDFRMDALLAWPALHQVTLHSWRDDLLQFLESSPLATELTLTGHSQRELDFSRTNLNRLSLDITGLERLVLPASLDLLILRGAGAPSDPALQVRAEQDGRWVSVHLTGAVPPVRGLDRVEGLRIGAIEALSLSDVSEFFPLVSWLHLFGAPGLLDELSELRALQNLETLWMCDLFGYEPKSFPSPAELPMLTSLDLDSVPVDVAASVRAAYRKSPRVELTVRRPRKSEWLAENLHNPLRRWDGREGIPDATAKKATAAFVAALRKVREADTTLTDVTEYATAVVAAVTDFLDIIAALNSKRHFLFTLERDEAIDAINVLTAGLSPEAYRALEPLIEGALDD